MYIDIFLDHASKMYYEGKPIITDEEFDFLSEKYNYVSCGYHVQEGVDLPFKMYSLQKIYKGEKEYPIQGSLVKTPKLDGVSLALIYVNGILKTMITRGNGNTGQDVSHLIPGMKVPKTIETNEPVIQVTGEAVVSKLVKNSRNVASGALGLKNLEEFKTRNLMFIAYGVQPYIYSTFEQDMEYLSYQGFPTVIDGPWTTYPQDGIVYRLSDNSLFDSAGFTNTHPKGAFALKERKAGVTTVLEDVVWQVGRTGEVSPVAILKPVKVGDATVSRATLHNMKYIEDLGLEIGCEVEVIRSGEIIPRVVRRI
jgi:DNA ligase (NAD+)